ncbi:MAG: DUF362 domain-containing protein [Candidatus Latescibacter sp.]|nr:DUF362 domain-containing protein [Candidatus Latescibacter sp.]
MKRRDFLKTSAALGAAGLAGQGCSSLGKTSTAGGDKFNVHPFIRQNPKAVFIHFTSVSAIADTAGIRQAGYQLSKELMVKSNDGFPMTAKVNVKPNWTSAGPQKGKPVFEKLGTNTDPNFIEGWVAAMKELGPQQYFIRECCCPTQWEPMGWAAMAARNNIDLRDLSTMDVWTLKEGRDIIFLNIPDGVLFKTMGYMAPMNEPGTCLVNIAKLKAHGMGITTTIKNLQGITAKRFHQFCTRYDSIRKQPRPAYETRYHQYFKDDFEKHLEALHARHMKEGYPRWDRPGTEGGIWQETWANRALDNLSVTPTALNMVEAIYSQDGNGFGIGPHEKLGPYGTTSRDYLSNIVIFGKDPFRVDIIAHWLAGHEPGNFGLFHIGIERKMSDVLDPRDIPLFVWKDGKAAPAKLESLKRTPLVTYYLQRDYNGQKEPRFHLCDEPFDYSAWKKGRKVSARKPVIENLGLDNAGRVNLSLTLPERDKVGVTVLNSRGEVVGRLLDGDLDAGVHHVVWDNFNSPGLYTAYVKGMGWDAVREMPIYPV